MPIEFLGKSPLKNKRFRARYKDKDGNIKNIDFGDPSAKTYIDGRTKKDRENYLKRHSAHPLEAKFINNFDIISPSLLSAHILWGKSQDIVKNIQFFNNKS